jgi:porphobilinogen synthase
MLYLNQQHKQRRWCDKAAAKMGWIDEDKAILETLTYIKRAGADFIATYFAKDAVRLLG